MSRTRSATIGLVLVLTLPIGCDYTRPMDDALQPLPPSPVRNLNVQAAPTSGAPEREAAERSAILESSIELIQRAALQPGGDNFRLATQKLNQFFEGTPVTEFQMTGAARAFLQSQFPKEQAAQGMDALRELESPNWGIRDARHLEDCMLYYAIASRVGGTGNDLDRVRRVFDWTVRQVQLVPPGALGSRQFPQVIARPYDVLVRAMATESEGFWAERSWVFMSLCRQLGVDVGLVTYTRGNVLEPRSIRRGASGPDGGLLGLSRPVRRVIPWICAALVEGEAYLFDARVGLPIPGPEGQPVATLDQVLADSSLLERMDLPGQSAYMTSRASLLASPSRIGVLLDSSPSYFCPRMKLLQGELSGKNRTILFRDPAEQYDAFHRVLGDRAGDIRLWNVPLEVLTQLFTQPQFVRSTEQTLFFFDKNFPLVYARIKHLRGDLPDAVQQYVSFRFAENLPQITNKKATVPREVQDGLDVYATYFLGLAHLERNNLDQAESMFRRLLDFVPEPGMDQPFYAMFRWGAHTNLGRIYEARGDRRQAIAHYTAIEPTMQYHGNLLSARELLWADPMAPPPDPLPPPPPRRATVSR